MKLKQTPEDFIVDEIYDLETFKLKQEDRKQPYYYFKLTKTNYVQMRALDVVAKTFNTSKKLVHFAGTKDKVGITSQIISIYGINDNTFEKNLEFFNEFKDLELEFIDKFKGRINLGDNLGNSFKITLRDLEEKDIKRAKEKLKELKKTGVLNLFDEQRFGYANNSHIVGKYILKNEVEKAMLEILTSTPSNPSDDLANFVKKIKENWQGIKEQDEDKINECISICPNYLKSESLALEHLKKHKNDFPGAFRRIHKKIRTLYINAYQSYLFNETIKQLKEENKLEKYKELPLISFDVELDDKIKKITEELMQKDDITYDNFKLPSMPELKLRPAIRKTLIFPRNLSIGNIENDELNENKNKVLIIFDLESGDYATNVVKQLFEK